MHIICACVCVCALCASCSFEEPNTNINASPLIFRWVSCMASAASGRVHQPISSTHMSFWRHHHHRRRRLDHRSVGTQHRTSFSSMCDFAAQGRPAKTSQVNILSHSHTLTHILRLFVHLLLGSKASVPIASQSTAANFRTLMGRPEW